MGEDEQLAIRFYRTGYAEDLAYSLCNLISDPALMREMAEHNFTAALCMTMPQIIGQYLRSFEIQIRQQELRRFSRFRRIPGWGPSRSAPFPIY